MVAPAARKGWQARLTPPNAGHSVTAGANICRQGASAGAICEQESKEEMGTSLYHMLLVCLGAALGGAARFFLSGLVGRRFGETFPWGTMAVNVSGALAIGIVAGTAARHDLPGLWAFAVTGGLGSYTTVSSFSLQTLALARDGEWLRAGGNILLSLVLTLAAAAVGLALGGLWGSGAS